MTVDSDSDTPDLLCNIMCMEIIFLAGQKKKKKKQSRRLHFDHGRQAQQFEDTIIFIKIFRIEFYEI
jgi:hypothetical protein